MSYFAQLDDDNVVVQVIRISNSDAPDPAPDNSEPLGQAFIASLGLPGVWKQTSYHATFRKNYAGIGYLYDAEADVFIPPKPYPSWMLDDDTCLWRPPTPYPDDGNTYVWDEDTLTWVEVEQ
jgi:hypothetical protein